MMLNTQQQLAVNWVVSKAKGQFAGRKPEYITSSEATVDSWIRNGNYIPPELRSIYGTQHWNEIISTAKAETKDVVSDGITYSAMIGAGLGIAAIINPAIVPIAIGIAATGFKIAGVTIVAKKLLGR